MSKLTEKISHLSPQQRELLLLRLKGLSQQREEGPLDQIPRHPRDADSYAVSYAQERFWFLDQLSPGNPADHIPGSLRLSGQLEVQALRQSFQSVLRRHEALRTAFLSLKGEPRQRIVSRLELPLPLIDLQSLPEARQEEQAGRLEGDNHRQPFSLDAPPLLRLRLLRLQEDQHVLLVTLHHIIADGWSLGVLVREVMAFYQAHCRNRTLQLPPLPIQYLDFALWQRRWMAGEAMDEQLAYWKQQLGGPLPVLELPADRLRPPFQTNNGARFSFSVPAGLSARLNAFSRSCNATLFMNLLSAYQMLLCSCSGQRDFLIGTPVANRTRPEIEPLIGFFINMLALRADLRGDPSFSQLLKRVRETTLGAFSHQEMPFEKLVEELQPQRDPSRSPLFQVMFVLQNVPLPATRVPELELRTDETDYGTAQYDLSLSLFEEPTGGLYGWFEYNTDLFDRVTVARLHATFDHLLAQAMKHPSRPLSQQLWLPQRWQHQVLREWNDSPELLDDRTPAHVLLAAQARQSPDALAAVCGQSCLSYAGLDRQSNRLARRLQQLGAGPESIVGLCLERRVELAAALAAIWKAGAIYLPLDAEYPQQRLLYILQDSGARVLLTAGKGMEGALEAARSVGCTPCRLDQDHEIIDALPGEAPAAADLPHLAAYLIYTSGSTGRPKGTVVEHSALASHLAWRRGYFRMEPSGRVLQKTSIGFDTSLWEFLEPLAAGGTVVLAEPGGQRDSTYLVQAIQRHHVTALDFVPSMLPFFLKEKDVEGCLTLERVNVGGETLSTELEKHLFERLGRIVAYSGYGPTEACIGVTFCARRGHEPPGTVPIGRPIAKTRIYLLDWQGRPVPPGATGELAIAGASLARGYLGRPALTARRFAPDPFAASPGGRLYLSGDLARHRNDGQLEFAGRVDHQVKVRGFRVELGEVEEVLHQQPGVREAVVVARSQGAETNQHLVAYLIPKDLDVAELRSAAARMLPDYMLPSAWVTLDAFLLTPSGKVDRQALPEPGQGQRLATGEFMAPRNHVEEVLAGIWAGLLDCGRVGVQDNFFELGGHSLLAIQMISRAREAFQVDVALRELFRHPTLAELAGLIAQLKGRGGDEAEVAAVPRIEPDRERLYDPFPLADVQQAYWIGRSRTLELGGVAAHSYSEFEGEGWDLERLNQAINRLVDRHHMLRAVVTEDGQQRILESVPAYQIEVQDLRQTTEEQAEEAVLSLRQRMSHQVIPADRWPLFEVCASLLPSGRVRLHVSIDGLIRDAWSARLLWSQLAQFYLDPDLELPPLDLSFRDCVLAELEMRQQLIYQRSLEYWQRRIPTLPPAPEVPMVKNLATVREPRFVRRWDRLPPEQWEAVKQQGASLGLTPTVVVLAVFADVLAAWSRSIDFTLNLTLFNRHPFHPQVGEIVGDFTSLVMVEVNDAVGGTFAERVGRVQQRLWDDLDHSYVSGVKVLRELARTRREVPRAYMPVVFTSTLALTESVVDTSDALDELPEVEMAYGISQTPQVTIDHQVAEQQGALIFIWDVVEDLFPPGLIEASFGAFRSLLHELAGGPEAWHKPSGPLTPAEQIELFAAANDTAAPRSDQLLHQLFRQRAAQQPEATALISPQGSLSYGELQRLASHLARRLRDMGAQPNSLVAVVMEKGWEQVAAVLAILEAGAAYLPIDAALPEERRDYLLANSQSSIALTQAGLEESLNWPQGLQRLAIVPRPGEEEAEPLAPLQSPQDLAYVIYTSGSTGQPKGVMIDHRGAVNTILDVNQRFEVSAADRGLALSALSFDLSVYDVFGTLAAGGCLVIPPAAARRDPSQWAGLMAEHQVTLWNSVPALLEMLLEWAEEHPDSQLESLRLALLSGDWIPLNLPPRLRRLAPQAEIISLGGATEASIWSILYPIAEIEDSWKSVPYGKPMRNQEFHVLDRLLRPAPVWVPGELYIGGIGLAQGYWGDPEKTSASFITHPESGQRLYRTGDLGRWRDDGNIEFLGREDLQVKVQGHRIELGEIEAALQEHPSVESAVAAALGGRHSKRLAGYFIPAGNGDSTAPSSEELRQFLRSKLPEHMVPAAFMPMQALPLNPNGKVDRSALPEIAAPAAEPKGAGAKAEGIAGRIAELVAEVLEVEHVDPDSNLIELGGSSIEIVRLANRLEDEFGFRPQMDEMFRLSINGVLVDFYEKRLERGEVYQSAAPLSGGASAGADSALLSSFSLLRDPEEREEFRQSQPGLRPAAPSDSAAIELPGPPLDSKLQELYLKRRSRRTFSPEAIPRQDFGNFLSALRQVSLDGRPKYLYASAGGLYPLQAHLYIKPERIEGIAAGIHYYDPVGHRLVTLSESGRLERNIHGWINQPIFDQSAFSIFFIAELGAIAPMYGGLSLEFCAIEAGLMAQLLESAAPDHGIGLCQIGSLGFEEVRHLFALQESQQYVYSLLGGRIDEQAEAALREQAEISDWEEGLL